MAWYPNQQGQPNNGQGPFTGYGPVYNPNTMYPPIHPPYNQYNYPQNVYYQQPHNYQQQMPGIPRLPLGTAISRLPNQYRRIVSNPSVSTFTTMMGNLDWRLIWLQLAFMILAYTIIGSLEQLFAPIIVGIASISSWSYASVLTETGPGSMLATLSILTVPITFFVGQGFQYILAKAFQGRGTFLQQSHTAVLFHVPLNVTHALLSALSYFVPILGYNIGPLITLAWFVYSAIINTNQIKAVHGLSGGKAATVVLIPMGLYLLFLCSIASALLYGAR